MSEQREQRDGTELRENEAVQKVLSNFQPVFVDVECADTWAALASPRYHSHLSGTRASLDPSFVFTYANSRRETKDLMNFKVTKKAKVLLAIYSSQKKFWKKLHRTMALLCVVMLSCPLILSPPHWLLSHAHQR